jgi:hypothetical protein
MPTFSTVCMNREQIIRKQNLKKNILKYIRKQTEFVEI